MNKPASKPSPPKKPLTFSEEMAMQMQKSMYMINQLTLVNNKKIREFRQRSESMHPDLQDFATIVSTQITVLEEKYKVLYDLVQDIYTKLDTLHKG